MMSIVSLVHKAPARHLHTVSVRLLACGNRGAYKTMAEV